MTIPDLINTVGVSLILAAYFLLALKRLHPAHPVYHLLNLTGAGLACYGSWLIGAVPFVVLEGVWAMVAAHGLWQYVRTKKSP